MIFFSVNASVDSTVKEHVECNASIHDLFPSYMDKTNSTQADLRNISSSYNLCASAGPKATVDLHWLQATQFIAGEASPFNSLKPSLRYAKKTVYISILM